MAVQDDAELLDMMLEDLDAQKDLYRPGPYWSGYVLRTEKAIHSDGLVDFRSNSRIGKGYADTVLINPLDLSTLDSWKSRLYHRITQVSPFKRRFVDPYLKHNELHFQQTQKYRDLYFTELLADWFSEFIEKYDLPETLIGNPQDIVSIKGHRIGRSYLGAFLRIHNYSKTVDFTKLSSVFEIGGGFGAFAHTLLHCFPNVRRYLYLDIPPILYVGTQYLKYFFGNDVTDYRATRSSKAIEFSPDDRREIIAVCPWQIERIDAEFDLFFNGSSFQEMTKDMVANYAQHIGRMLGGNSGLCLYVYREGKPDRTLLPEDICGIVEKSGSIQFEEVEPEVEIGDAHYFFGHRK